jgi:hypothetical protein
MIMTSKEFVLKELEILTSRIPNIRVRYEYDKNAIVHIIEVVPNEIYHLDNDYIAWESDMDYRFIELYPTENICFISDDALVGIENAEYVLCGLNYAPFSTKKEAMILNQSAIVIQQNGYKQVGSRFPNKKHDTLGKFIFQNK